METAAFSVRWCVSPTHAVCSVMKREYAHTLTGYPYPDLASHVARVVRIPSSNDFARIYLRGKGSCTGALVSTNPVLRASRSISLSQG